MSIDSSMDTMHSEVFFFAEKAKQLLSGFAPLAVVLFILPWIMDFLPSTSDYRMLLDVGFIASSFDVSDLAWLSYVLVGASFAHMLLRFARSCACLASGRLLSALESPAFSAVEKAFYWVGLFIFVMSLAFHVVCQAIAASASADRGLSETGSIMFQPSDFSSVGALLILAFLAVLVPYVAAVMIYKKNKGNDSFDFLQEWPLMTWFLMALIISCIPLVFLGICIAVFAVIATAFSVVLTVFVASICLIVLPFALRIALMLLCSVRIRF